MNFLFTADFQADWSNLDMCQQAWDQILHICSDSRLEGVGVCGDAKKVYNPVDIRVVKWWQSAIARAVKLGIRVIMINGNHDRIGQYDDQQNWLSVLRRAGAEVFDRPAVVPTSNGQLCILPFCTDTQLLRHWAKDLAERRHADVTRDILLFHCDIKHARYNMLGRRSDAAFKAQDFKPMRYLACIGGHIHDHQQIGRNIFYTGSPFCTDWGEANQTKCYVVVQSGRVRTVRSRIPGWYDNTWPGFPTSKKDWIGVRVRIHVPCKSTQSYAGVLDKALQQSQRIYPGATLVVVPEFQDDEKKSATLKTTDPDSVKIKAYVQQTVPQDLKVDAGRVSQYLIRKLEQAVGHSVRSVSGIKFTKATATNFLSFKKVACDFTKPGITVVRGINHDWQGRSNGAGKTSFLQLIPVALFGTTFKGQKYDRWSRRGSKDCASVEIAFEDGRGRQCRVNRSRRPTAVHFSIGGRDHSSGLRGDARDGTQGLIEQLTGFTWQTLANSVYIDPSIAHVFLSGTRKERSQVLARFQNLERFEKALVKVKYDAGFNESALMRVVSELDSVASMIIVAECNLAELRKTLHDIDRDAESRVTALHDRYVTMRAEYVASTKRRARELHSLRDACEAARKRFQSRTGEAAKASNRMDVCASGLEAFKTFDASKTDYCPTCFQDVKAEYVDRTRSKLQSMHKTRCAEFQKLRTRSDRAKEVWESLQAQIDEIVAESAAEEARVATAKKIWEFAKQSRFEDQELRRGKEAVANQTREIQRLSAKRKMMLRARNAHKASATFYEYAQQAFSRDGIPAFLNRQLVPVLNKEADYYSDLFCDRTVQVRFEVIDGEFAIKTINASGGDSTEDQSTGERALAGLVASFALRSIAPKSNVLVLDEPGAGLDSGNSAKFAAALRIASRRFGSVHITSHNSAILSELEEEHTITVEKKKGISMIV